MRKDNDIEALKRQSSSEFDYQNFSTDKRSSGNKQRWKLLEGVANCSPGGRKSHVRKSGEFSPADAPDSEETPRLIPQASAPKQEKTVPVSHINGQAREYRIEESSRTIPVPPNERGVGASKPVLRTSSPDKTSTSQPASFGNLFKGYTENSQDVENSPQTSLKALLRQIDS